LSDLICINKSLSITKLNNNLLIVKPYGLSLRESLNSYNRIGWSHRLNILACIAYGISELHNLGFIHRNINSETIINFGRSDVSINSLGICQAISSKDNNDIFDVLAYTASEVLTDKEYNQGSDIYSFRILAYEIIIRLPPYYNMAHDQTLVKNILRGYRPEFSNEISLWITEIIKKCWNKDPDKCYESNHLYLLLSDINNNT